MSMGQWVIQVNQYFLSGFNTIATVQLNSNLTLARVSLAETQLIFKYARLLHVGCECTNVPLIIYGRQH